MRTQRRRQVRKDVLGLWIRIYEEKGYKSSQNSLWGMPMGFMQFVTESMKGSVRM